MASNNDDQQPRSPPQSPQQTLGDVAAQPREPVTVYNIFWLVVGITLAFFGIVQIITMSLFYKAIDPIDCTGIRALAGIFLVAAIAQTLVSPLVILLLGIKKFDNPADVPTESPPPLVAKIILGTCLVIWYIGGIIVSAIGVSFYIMSVNVAPTDKDYSGASSLTDSVTITRDDNGIPHIVGNTLADAVFAQGFVHAQDRLLQLELTRLAARGQLAKHLGETLVETDKSLLAAGFWRAGLNMCENLNPTARGHMLSYVNGINFYIKNEGARPPEFMFFENILQFHEPDDFTIEDCCGMFRLLQWLTSMNFDREAERWKLFADGNLNHSQIEDLWSDPTNTTSILSAEELGYSEIDAVAARAREANDRALERSLYDNSMGPYRNTVSSASRRFHAQGNKKTKKDGQKGDKKKLKKNTFIDKFRTLSGMKSLFTLPQGGSNAWMGRAPGGAATGVSDPHLQAVGPSTWHNAHLKWGTSGDFAAGVTAMGLPGILVGRTRTLSWGITMSMTDLTDLFVMQPSTVPGQEKTHYMLNGVPTPYTIRTETIEVAGGSSETLQVYESVYGPDIAETWEISTKHRLCLWAQAARNDTTSMNAVLSIWNTATTVQQFQAILLQVKAPGLSIVIADTAGTLGWQLTGQHPLRRPGHTGRMPILGNGAYTHAGMIPTSQNPSKLVLNNGAAAYVEAANEKATADGFPYTLSYDWSAPIRAAAIQRHLKWAMANNQSLLSDVEWHKAVQTDTTSNLWVDTIRPGLNESTVFGADFQWHLNDKGRQQLEKMKNWDNKASIGSKEASFFTRWLLEMGELPVKAKETLGYPTWFPKWYVLRILFDVTPYMLELCQSYENRGFANCTEYAAHKWNEASGNTERWGQDINKIEIRHSFADDSVLECIFNFGGEKAGDRGSINVADEPLSKLDDDLISAQVASMRQVYDMATLDRYWFALPGGNHGSPWSKYYRNLMLAFTQDKYTEIKLVGFSGESQVISP